VTTKERQVWLFDGEESLIRRLCIAIPASVVADTPHLREKTAKIGLIGRAAAIFRVAEINLYFDDRKVNQTKDAELIRLLLSYMETPQYLRKRLFPLKPELQYAGILPPLRTPHHPLNSKACELADGSYREAVTLSKNDKATYVDVGVETPIPLTDGDAPLNRRITVRIVRKGNEIHASKANRNEIPNYWGFTVNDAKPSFSELVKSGTFGLVIATSRYGREIKEASREIGKRWENAGNILIAFGSPSRGLQQIIKSEGSNIENTTDYVVNTIPGQGTETVRTEEALIATLAVLNVHFHV
jgi:predicted SPOUT superfamily RNA methylase MTH1